jgi:hypothetical protein
MEKLQFENSNFLSTERGVISFKKEEERGVIFAIIDMKEE